MIIFRTIRAWWWCWVDGLCPECGHNAPAIYTCTMCEADIWITFSRLRRRAYWTKWKWKHFNKEGEPPITVANRKGWYEILYRGQKPTHPSVIKNQVNAALSEIDKVYGDHCDAGKIKNMIMIGDSYDQLTES